MYYLFSSINSFLRLLAPKAMAILLILFSFLPFKLTGMSYFIPLFDIMIIYYWSIYHPKLFPEWFVLLMGILQDILYGLPIGVTALSNLIFREIIVSRRRFFIKETFVTIWLNFAMFSFIAAGLKWMIASIVFNELFSGEIMLIQWMLTASLYAWMHWLFNKLYMLLPSVTYAK